MGPDPRNPRFPLFDSLRAIAALCVLLTHVSFASLASYESVAGPFLAQLTVGVPIFFLISGFLLYRPFFAARFHGEERPRAWSFARHRVLRVVPAYWLALTAIAVGPGLTGVLTGDWWIYYGFVQIYSDSTVLDGLSQAWSLCVEVTFYAVLPLYALLLERLSRRREARAMVRLDLLALALVFAACMVFRAFADAYGTSTWFLTLPATADWFALGMALAVLSVAFQEREEPPALVRLVTARPGVCWIGAGAAFVVTALALDLPRGFETDISALQRTLQHLLFGACATLLLLPAVFGDRAGGIPRRILAWGPLAWLGTISYGVFLYNLAVVTELEARGVQEWVPVGRFAGLALATLVVTVACAATSWYLMERPLLRRKRPGGGARAPIASGAPVERGSA